MKQHLFAICLLSFSLLTPASVRADICDDINDLANDWQKVANYIAENTDGGDLKKSAGANLLKMLKELYPGTREFAAILAKEAKDQRIKSLGKQMVSALDELDSLDDDDEWDEDVEIINRMVDVIDKITDECDKA